MLFMSNLLHRFLNDIAEPCIPGKRNNVFVAIALLVNFTIGLYTSTSSKISLNKQSTPFGTINSLDKLCWSA